MEKGSKEILWMSHTVPLPGVMHKGENESRTSDSKCQGKATISDAVEQVEAWESFRRHPGAPPQLLQMEVRNAMPVFA